MHPAELDVDQLLRDCEIQFSRRRGPGGQHRNKVETAVILVHLPSKVSAEANEKRSQDANRQEAIFRLRLALAVEIRTQRKSTSELLKSRTKEKRFVINPRHDDFPSLLAEVLDHTEAKEYEIPDTAEKLNVSGSQLLKFLKLYPPAFEKFNQERAKRDLHRIKF